MNNGNDGTSTALTVDAAKSVFEGMLSDAEDTQTSETPTPDAPAGDEGESQSDIEGEAEQPEIDGASEQGDEEDGEQQAATSTYRVKVDGEEIEVTVDELLKGYSRTQDYTRKTQQVAEQRKAAEAEIAAVRSERQQYAQHLTKLSEALQAQTPAEPDWAHLQQTASPAEFAATWASWQQHKQRVEQVEAERQRATDAVIADQRTEFAKTIEAEKAKLVEAIPAWSDAETAKREKGELREFAKSLGYSDSDLAQVYDHRLMLVLRKAMLHDKAQKARPAVQQKLDKVKAATPGPGAQGKRQVTELTKAKQALAKTGRVDDAARAFMEMLD